MPYIYGDSRQKKRPSHVEISLDEKSQPECDCTDKAQERSTEQEGEGSNTKGPMAMAHLAWVASELGSATGFPKTTIIPQKPQPDEGPGVVAGRCER